MARPTTHVLTQPLPKLQFVRFAVVGGRSYRPGDDALVSDFSEHVTRSLIKNGLAVEV